MPATSIAMPIKVLLGYRMIVLSTTNQHAAMNKMVVNGCPGVRVELRPSRFRKTKMQQAVNPKKMKSIETT